MVETRTVRQRILGHLQQINGMLAEQVAAALGEGAMVAFLINANIDAGSVSLVKQALKKVGAMGELVGPNLGMMPGADGNMKITKTFANTNPSLYDTVFVPGGRACDVKEEGRSARVSGAGTQTRETHWGTGRS